MILLKRPAGNHERRLLRSAVEVVPIRVEAGVASVECRTEVLARVAERNGFRRVETGHPTPPSVPVSAPVLPEPDPREAFVDAILEGSVEDLDAALNRGDLDSVLAVAYIAERGGKDRVTAKRAILARSRRIGVSFNIP